MVYGLDRQSLVSLVGKGFSIREIAKTVQSNYTVTRYWLRHFNLKTQKRVIFKCQCGETDPLKFYGHKRSICGKCSNEYNLKKGQENRKRIVEALGGKCILCGYDKFPCSLDAHHKDPSKKDPNFSNARYWSWERIEKELEGCCLLCRNCHAAVHAGFLGV